MQQRTRANQGAGPSFKGAVEFYAQPKKPKPGSAPATGTNKAAQPVSTPIQWERTLASKVTNLPHPMSTQTYRQAKSLITLTGDKAQIGSHVIYGVLPSPADVRNANLVALSEATSPAAADCVCPDSLNY